MWRRLLQRWRDWRAREAYYKQKCVESLAELRQINRNIAANQAETARLRVETEVILDRLKAALWELVFSQGSSGGRDERSRAASLSTVNSQLSTDSTEK